MSEAAQKLGVNPGWVRQLAQRGDLNADRVGDRWVIQNSELERFLRQQRVVGRPYSQRIAWAILWEAGCQEADWIRADERSRLRQRLRANPWDDLIPRLRKRARIEMYYAHPAVLEAIESDHRSVVTGSSAALRHGLDLVVVGKVDCYLQQEHLDEFVADHGLMSVGGSEANLWIRVVDDFWPFSSDDDAAPVHIAALDLMDDGDPRSVRAASPAIEAMRLSLAQFAHGGRCDAASDH